MAVKRAEGRKRLRVLLVFGGVSLVLVAAWAATRSAILDVDHFDVNGLSTHSETDVISAARIDRGVPLVDVDLGLIDLRVDQLPWVKEAKSARQWPGTIRIDVVERVPMALIPAGDGVYAVIDEASVVTGEVTLASAPDLPVIDVALDTKVGAVEDAAIPGLAVVAAMPSDVTAWVQLILVDPESGKVGLDLVGSAKVDLGDISLLADKLESLRSVLAGADLRCVELIDASVADLPTIKRNAECESSAGIGADTPEGG